MFMFASVVHAAAVTEGLEEATVTSITRVTAGKVMAQAGLLMRNTATGGASASSLQLYGFTPILWPWQQKKLQF